MDTYLDAVRVLPVPVEFRDGPDGTLGMMSGHFSTFGEFYEIDSMFEGQFMERVAKGAFKKTIAEQNDGAGMKVLYEHGRDTYVGNKPMGVPETVREDKTGAYYAVPLLDTSYNRDLLPALKAGAFGASFRFQAIKDEWNDEPGISDANPKGLPERTLKECRVPEFGPCTFPANPGGTATARSATDDWYEMLRSRDPKGYDELLARARQIRTPALRDAEGANVGDGAADETPDEPHKHSADPMARDRALRLLGVLR